jgi:hypothetical protein
VRLGGSYRDNILEGPELAETTAICLLDGTLAIFPTDEILIGGFGLGSVSQVAIWKRLIEESMDRRPNQLWFECDRNFLAGYLPESSQEHAYLAIHSNWSALKSNQLSNSFALVTNSEGMRLAFIGLPTEEGLDQLVNFSRS